MKEEDNLVHIQDFKENQNNAVCGNTLSEALQYGDIDPEKPIFYEGKLYRPIYFGCMECMLSRDATFDTAIHNSVFKIKGNGKYFCAGCNSHVRKLKEKIRLEPDTFSPNKGSIKAILGFYPEGSQKSSIYYKKLGYSLWKSHADVLLESSSLIS